MAPPLRIIGHTTRICAHGLHKAGEYHENHGVKYEAGGTVECEPRGWQVGKHKSIVEEDQYYVAAHGRLVQYECVCFVHLVQFLLDKDTCMFAENRNTRIPVYCQQMHSCQTHLRLSVD